MSVAILAQAQIAKMSHLHDLPGYVTTEVPIDSVQTTMLFSLLFGACAVITGFRASEPSPAQPAICAIFAKQWTLMGFVICPIDSLLRLPSQEQILWLLRVTEHDEILSVYIEFREERRTHDLWQRLPVRASTVTIDLLARIGHDPL